MCSLSSTHMSTNPTVISDDDWLSIFNILSSALYLCLVRGSEDGHIRPYHDPIAAGIGESEIGILREQF